MKKLVRALRNKQYDNIEVAVREATCNDTTGAHPETLDFIVETCLKDIRVHKTTAAAPLRGAADEYKAGADDYITDWKDILSANHFGTAVNKTQTQTQTQTQTLSHQSHRSPGLSDTGGEEFYKMLDMLWRRLNDTAQHRYV